MSILKIIHNAGFFSCFSKRLEGAVWFFNKNRCLPDKVDSSEQFSLFKSDPEEDLADFYFQGSDYSIKYEHDISFNNDKQFSDYRKLDFAGLKPFIKKYFSPSEQVNRAVSFYENKYNINYDNTCVVFYRGNDKFTETGVATYDNFLSKAREFRKNNPSVIFLVQTDETGFLEVFLKEFPGSLSFTETPSMDRRKSTIHDELPLNDRKEHGRTFFAAILVLSKCKYIITHSGNGALWCVLYRGNCNNVYQCLNDSWALDNIALLTIWLSIKRLVKKIFRIHPYWLVIKP